MSLLLRDFFERVASVIEEKAERKARTIIEGFKELDHEGCALVVGEVRGLETAARIVREEARNLEKDDETDGDGI